MEVILKDKEKSFRNIKLFNLVKTVFHIQTQNV